MAKKKRRKKHFFLWLTLAIALVLIAFIVMRSSLFNVSKIIITGNDHYSKLQILDIAGISADDNAFFDISLDDAKNSLMEATYIEYAFLSRQWTTISIEVIEREEFAAISFGDQFVIVDEDGIILRFSDSHEYLPVIDGLTLIDPVEGASASAEQDFNLSRGIALLKKCDSIDFYFERLDFGSSVLKAYIYYDEYYCVGLYSSISDGLPAIKSMVEDQYKNNIKHGIIHVGTNNYLSFEH